jgi:hypothetical protein
MTGFEDLNANTVDDPRGVRERLKVGHAIMGSTIDAWRQGLGCAR